MKYNQISKVTYSRAIVLWGIVSLVPMIPFTLPLFQLSLSDSPRAYLIWIPFLAIAWSAWNLTTKPLPTKAASQAEGAGIGVFISLIVFTALMLGKSLLPNWFFHYDIGLLCWPIWSLGMFWLIFGMKASRRAVLPLLYMLLGWPPIYEGIIAIVNPVLAAAALKVMGFFGSVVSWMTIPQSEDVFDVATSQGIVHVSVTSACSGSDTILAVLVIFPIMLVLFQLTLRTKVLLVIVGCVLAFVFNLLRIIAIITALHYFGYHVAIDILHPVLGTALFILIIGLLLAYGGKHVATVSPRFSQTVGRAVAPSALSLGFAVLLTVALVPLYSWETGSELRPLTLNTTHLEKLTRGLFHNDANVTMLPTTYSRSNRAVFIRLPAGTQGVELSLSDSLDLVPFSATTPSEVMSPSGQLVKVQSVKLLAQSHAHGTDEKTYLIDFIDTRQGQTTTRTGQYLDTVSTLIAVHDFHRVYLTSQWAGALRSGAETSTSSTLVTLSAALSAALTENERSSRTFVQQFVANANQLAQSEAGTGS
ncbi:exosortase/archaeosortase family protein [Alicyclobacillus curvatus]|nr:exosortase/archaeosortase family protein [Alicyclobacillus curvatus]